MTDWAVGDWAERIPDPEEGRPPSEKYAGLEGLILPPVGSVSAVTNVELAHRQGWPHELVYIGLAGIPSDCVVDARMFRKVDKSEIAAMVAAAEDIAATEEVPA